MIRTQGKMMTTGFELIIAIVLGAVLGSFLNVVIWRGPALWGLIDVDGPARGTLASPRSYCTDCRAPISIANNIPILSFIFLRGRCADCGARISSRYLIVEVLGAAAAVAALALFGFSLSWLIATVFFLSLIALAAIDWETGYLPDAITLPLIALGVGANIGGRFVPFADAVIGAVVGYGVFWLISVGYRHLRKRDGLGLGDAKLLAAIGAWCGWMGLPLVLFAASIIGLWVLGVRRLMGEKITAQTPIPFGPALAMAGGGFFIVRQLVGDGWFVF